MNKTYVSFVVDKHPKFYFQSELLLWSLMHNAGIPKEDIVIQCTQEVDSYFIEFLKLNEYNYCRIQKFLDGKYCNKLKQLDYFEKIEGNVLLLDTDTFVLDNIFPTDKSQIAGKVVDVERPPLYNLEVVFRKAGLNIIETIQVECIDRKTVHGNLNGGYYFIPHHLKNNVNTNWKKWGPWLYEKKHLLGTSYTMHIDQVAFALAINELKLTVNLLDNTYNFPLHLTEKSSIAKNQKIKLIHYHHLLDNMGLLGVETKHKALNETIRNSNKQIASINTNFDTVYRKSILKNYSSEAYTDLIRKYIPKTNKKLVFHIGASKTGTTSLQFHLEHQSNELSQYDIQYAKNISTDTYAPKHQWMMETLYEEKYDLFLENINIGMQTDCSTVIFSTEGIYNHWFDYSYNTKNFLSNLVKEIHVEVVLYVRNLPQFLYSLYKQYIKNRYYPLFGYGSDKTYCEQIHFQWFRKHANFYSLIIELQEVFGDKNLKIIRVNGDTIVSFFDYLGVDTNLFPKKERKNISLSNREIEWLRRAQGTFGWSRKSRVRNSLLKTARLVNKIVGDIQPQQADQFIIDILEKESDLLNTFLIKD